MEKASLSGDVHELMVTVLYVEFWSTWSFPCRHVIQASGEGFRSQWPLDSKSFSSSMASLVVGKRSEHHSTTRDEHRCQLSLHLCLISNDGSGTRSPAFSSSQWKRLDFTALSVPRQPRGAGSSIAILNQPARF